MHGVPRVVLLRQLRVLPHLEREIARIVALHNRQDPAPNPTTTEPAAEAPGVVRHRRTRQTDTETDNFLAELRAAGVAEGEIDP